MQALKYKRSLKLGQLIAHLQQELQMESISTVMGKLLYFANWMAQNKKISLREKGLLKDLILADSRQVMNVYNSYVNEGTELTLASDLIHIVRIEKDAETQENSSQESYKIKRGNISVKIPARNIQKLSMVPNRI